MAETLVLHVDLFAGDLFCYFLIRRTKTRICTTQMARLSKTEQKTGTTIFQTQHGAQGFFFVFKTWGMASCHLVATTNKAGPLKLNIVKNLPHSKTAKGGRPNGTKRTPGGRTPRPARLATRRPRSIFGPQNDRFFDPKMVHFFDPKVVDFFDPKLVDFFDHQMVDFSDHQMGKTLDATLTFFWTQVGAFQSDQLGHFLGDASGPDFRPNPIGTDRHPRVENGEIPDDTLENFWTPKRKTFGHQNEVPQDTKTNLLGATEKSKRANHPGPRRQRPPMPGGARHRRPPPPRVEGYYTEGRSHCCPAGRQASQPRFYFALMVAARDSPLRRWAVDFLRFLDCDFFYAKSQTTLNFSVMFSVMF